MKINKKLREHGQVLVILMIGIVGLLAFTALAIDGGMYYSDRRYDQNASDASSLAGAGAAATQMKTYGINYNNFTCVDTEEYWPDVQKAINAAIAEAQSRATANNFTIDPFLDNEHGVEVDCVDVPPGTYGEKYLDVHVMITTTVQTAFAHMFFSGPFRNTVETITRVHPRASMGYGMAIVALNEDCNTDNDGIKLAGTSTVELHFSGAHSNGCLKAKGNIDITIVSTGDGAITYMDTYTETGKANVDPDPNKITTKIETNVIDPPPKCEGDGMEYEGDIQHGGDLVPGRYDSIRVGNNEALHMAPGLYCVQGNFEVNGGEASVGSYIDEVWVPFDDANDGGVTIYVITGVFKTVGSATVNLQAPRMSEDENGDPVPGDGVPHAILGLLIYLPPENDSTVTMAGNSNSSYRGTVFAPGSLIDVTGGSGSINEFGTQFIGKDITITGDSSLTIYFDGDDIWTGGALLDLIQ